MKKYVVRTIPIGNFFSKAVYLDRHFILTAPETPFSEELAAALIEWGFQEVFSDGEPGEQYIPEEDDSVPVDIGDLSTMRDEDKIRQADFFYVSFQGYVEQLFAEITTWNELNCNNVVKEVKTLVDAVRKDRRFLMQAQMRAQKEQEPPGDNNYLVSHSVRSTVIAVVIGTYLKLPVHRLIELGVAALLHEVGMLKLSPAIYLNRRTLTAEERKAITGHPIQSFNLLKSFDFPLVVSVAALEHHERENGSGYPQHLNGDKISLYAKIIAVACSYEALSSKRPYKEAKDGYTGMIELLKNEGGQYDDTVVRALVFSLSIYPIGLYVLLSNNKKGQVVDVNPENPRYPIVQIFGELTPDGKNKTVQTASDGLFIIRPLSRDEIGG